MRGKPESSKPVYAILYLVSPRLCPNRPCQQKEAGEGFPNPKPVAEPCDEGHPACRNCVKHGVDCDFIIATPSSSSALPSPSIQLCSCNHEPSSGFTINDLELLHHYTTSACLTFSTEPMVRNFWRVNVPQMGFTTPYILKGMLSLSALHLAKFRPDRKDFYVAQAFLHHNAAVNMVSPIITKITVENCVPVFLFSTITNYFAFAKPKESDDFLLSSHSAPPDWLMLFRGVRALMEAEHAVIHHSSVAAMFETGIAMHQYWLSHTFENEAFRELEANIRLNLRDEPEKLDVLMQAMATLKRSYATVYESPQTIAQTDENKVRGIFIWLFKLSNPYIMLCPELAVKPENPSGSPKPLTSSGDNANCGARAKTILNTTGTIYCHSHAGNEIEVHTSSLRSTAQASGCRIWKLALCSLCCASGGMRLNAKWPLPQPKQVEDT
ncbi:hypothetical protein TruAng_008765 [Truncatella angustata]|nr:hypothetical protein TruAng_008765 [Truncatella angustata]